MSKVKESSPPFTYTRSVIQLRLPPSPCFRRSNKSSSSSSSSSHACRSLIWSENYNYGSKHRLEKTHKAEKTQKRRFHWNGTNHHQKKKQKTEKEKKYRSGDQTTHFVSFCFVSVQQRPQAAAAAAAICCIIASEALPQRTGAERSKGPRSQRVSEVSCRRVSFQPWQGESFSFRKKQEVTCFFLAGGQDPEVSCPPITPLHKMYRPLGLDSACRLI